MSEETDSLKLRLVSVERLLEDLRPFTITHRRASDYADTHRYERLETDLTKRIDAVLAQKTVIPRHVFELGERLRAAQEQARFATEAFESKETELTRSRQYSEDRDAQIAALTQQLEEAKKDSARLDYCIENWMIVHPSTQINDNEEVLLDREEIDAVRLK